MSKYLLYPVIVCIQQSDGAPAFHVCTPEVTQAQIDDGDHYEMAIQNARDLGYKGEAVVFDMTDPAASQLGQLSLMASKIKSGQIALEILTLDGGTVSGSEDGDPGTERVWLYKGKHGEEMSHVCVEKGEADLMFTSWAFSCSQNHWLREVTSGSTVDGYVDWAQQKLREIRESLRAKNMAAAPGVAS